MWSTSFGHWRTSSIDKSTNFAGGGPAQSTKAPAFSVEHQLLSPELQPNSPVLQLCWWQTSSEHQSSSSIEQRTSRAHMSSNRSTGLAAIGQMVRVPIIPMVPNFYIISYIEKILKNVILRYHGYLRYPPGLEHNKPPRGQLRARSFERGGLLLAADQRDRPSIKRPPYSYCITVSNTAKILVPATFSASF